MSSFSLLFGVRVPFTLFAKLRPLETPLLGKPALRSTIGTLHRFQIGTVWYYTLVCYLLITRASHPGAHTPTGQRGSSSFWGAWGRWRPSWGVCCRFVQRFWCASAVAYFWCISTKLLLGCILLHSTSFSSTWRMPLFLTNFLKRCWTRWIIPWFPWLRLTCLCYLLQTI